MEAGSQRLDLTACAQEPIHIPGLIQPRGVLIGVNDEWIVTHAAGPSGRFFAHPQLLGHNLKDLVPAATFATIASAPIACQRAGRNNRICVELRPRTGGVQAEILLHRNDQGVLILECEDAADPQHHGDIDDGLAEIVNATCDRSTLDAAVRTLQLLTGFNRVIGYIFDHDFNGSVISEVVDPGLISYKNQRFPSGDIPEQARRLYKRKRARLIADVNYRPAPIAAAPGAVSPLDLSDADLRSVSPAHIEYLQNMKLGATLVCSLLRDGELLGMLACHHVTPHYVAPSVRERAVLIADVTAARLATLRDTAVNRRTIAAYRQNAELLHALTLDHESVDMLGRHVERLHRMIDAGGAAVVIGDRVYSAGRTPGEADIRMLAGLFTPVDGRRIGFTHHLASIDPEFRRLNDVAAGVLSVPLRENHPDAVLWFRPEIVASVNWAGNPHKSVVADERGMRLTPRKSFESYVELVRDHSTPWQSWELEVAESVRGSVTNIVSQLRQLSELANERRRAEQAARAHAAELEVAGRAMAEARDLALAASRAKSEFLANMSHEIRTPMTAILGYTELLSSDGDRDMAPVHRLEYIATIRRNGEHLLTVINDILDLSKIEAGKMTCESAPTDLVQLLRDVAALMDVKARAKSIALSVRLDTAVPEIIISDALRLRQILVNLTGNAVKFTETGGVVLAVSFDPAGGMMRFDVIDSGIGMTPEQCRRIFNAFVQADTSTTRRFGGTGLGLLISKRLAGILGGDITVESEIGRGSRFTLSISCRPGPDVRLITPDEAPIVLADPHRVHTDTAASAVDQPLAGVRILLAEDGLDNQRLISFHLSRAGADVRTVDNGRLAVEALTSDHTLAGPLQDPTPVDLLVTDMQMPELDGYSATRLLRSKGCTLPIIALTAHAMAGERDKCVEAGCDAYATKPIDRASLIQTCLDAVDAFRRGAGRSPAVTSHPAVSGR